MDNSDKTTVVPQDQQVTPDHANGQAPEYTYQDLQKPMREVAESTQSETPPPQPPVEPTIPEEPEIPVEKVIEDTTRKVLEEQEAARAAQEETQKPPEPTDEEKQYIEWEKNFNTQNSRPPTYLEAMRFVKDQAVSEIETRQAEKLKAQEEEQTQQRVAKEEEEKRINAFVDDELAEAYDKGLLTKIQDPNNPSDQGVVEKKALFTKWKEINDQRRAEGKPEIISATRILNYYWQRPNTQPPGADAPISGNRGSATPPSTEQQYSYADLKKPWSFFKRG